MKMLKRLVIILLILMCSFQPVTAEAKDVADISDFDSLEGDAAYLGKKYRNNYNLDIEKTGMLETGDKMINDIANILFSLVRTLGYLIVSIFYFAMDFDISKLLASQINSIQSALNTGIFKPLFTLAVVGTSFVLIKRMAKRDIIGAAGDIVKVIGIVILSILVVKQSATALSYCTNITKSISMEALTSVNGGTLGEGKTFASSAAGIIWVSLVHQPWVTLEFDQSAYTQEDIKSFLSTAKGSDERKDLVKKFDEPCFNKERGGERIGFIIIYFIPFLIKSAIFLLVSLMQLLFQVMAVLYLLAAPIILILALIPAYGTNMISTWLRKILETQISILIITFLMGLLIRLDSTMAMLTPQYGWFIVLAFQTAMAVGLFLGRNKILDIFSGVQTAMNMPTRYMQTRIRRFGNPYRRMQRLERQGVKRIYRDNAGRQSARVVRNQQSRSRVMDEKEPSVAGSGYTKKTKEVREERPQGNENTVSRALPAKVVSKNNGTNVERPRSVVKKSEEGRSESVGVSNEQGYRIKNIRVERSKEGVERDMIQGAVRPKRMAEKKNVEKMPGNDKIGSYGQNRASTGTRKMELEGREDGGYLRKSNETGGKSEERKEVRPLSVSVENRGRGEKEREPKTDRIRRPVEGDVVQTGARGSFEVQVDESERYKQVEEQEKRPVAKDIPEKDNRREKEHRVINKSHVEKQERQVEEDRKKTAFYTSPMLKRRVEGMGEKRENSSAGRVRPIAGSKTVELQENGREGSENQNIMLNGKPYKQEGGIKYDKEREQGVLLNGKPLPSTLKGDKVKSEIKLTKKKKVRASVKVKKIKRE